MIRRRVDTANNSENVDFGRIRNRIAKNNPFSELHNAFFSKGNRSIEEIDTLSSLIWALPLTFLTYLAMFSIKAALALPSEHLVGRLVEGKGGLVIPFVTLWSFFFGLIYSLQLYNKMIKPIVNSKNKLFNSSRTEEMSHIKRVEEKLEAAIEHEIKVSEYYPYLNRDRLDRKIQNIVDEDFFGEEKEYCSEKFIRLFKKRVDESATHTIEEYKDKLFSIDEEKIAAAFVPLKLIEWVLPLLGFLGTVIGVSEAIIHLQGGMNKIFEAGALVKGAKDFFEAGFLNLGFAFDTTLLGLFFLLLVGWLHSFLRKEAAQQLLLVRDVFTDLISTWKPFLLSPSEVKLQIIANSASSTAEYLRKINESTRYVGADLFDISSNTLLQVESIDKINNALQKYTKPQLENIVSNFDLQRDFNDFMLETFEIVVTEADGFEAIKAVLFKPVIEAHELSVEIRNELDSFAQNKGIISKRLETMTVSSQNHLFAFSIYADTATGSTSYIHILSFENEQICTFKIYDLYENEKATNITLGTKGESLLGSISKLQKHSEVK